MALKSNSREFTKLNGESSTVFVRQGNATESLELLSRLFFTCRHFILPFIEGTATFTDQTSLLQVVNPEHLPSLLKDVVLKARKDGKEVTPASFNMEYGGELDLIWSVFGLVCETNFKEFCVNGLASIAEKPSETDSQDADTDTIENTYQSQEE